MTPAAPRTAAVERAYRAHAARLLALLVHEQRSFDLAEDALQEAFEAAARQWPDEGAPANAPAWLLTVARRRARDRMRRETALARKLPLLVTDAARPGPDAGDRGPGRAEAGVSDGEPGAADDGPDAAAIPDERLRLVFTSCHPAIARPAQIALTLRFVAGLATRAIARLLLVSEPTMAARITRAKRKIAEAGIPYRVPRDEELPERLASVLLVVYLVFTEGYAPSAGDRLVRVELCEEAIRLGRVLAELLPGEPEVAGLLALMLLQHARRDARADAAGRLVLLTEQDRSRWHRDEIAEGRVLAARAAAGPYALQALIAAEHARAADAQQTDWTAIAALYAQLEAIAPSPVVRLNRAVAVAEADGPAAGLRLLDELGEALPRSHQPATVRAELLLRLGDAAGALAAYDRALALASNGAVRAHLAERRAQAQRAIGR